MTKFEELFTKIGFEIPDEALVQEAFTHRSTINEKSNTNLHNERLEFLGDAVLELVATEFLFKKFPKKPEGKLTNLRSALVKGDHLSEVARNMNLGQYLIMSKGEEKSGGRNKDYLLANVVEAFIGAIYLGKDFSHAQDFIEKFILCHLEKIMSTRGHIDAKSEFQEIAQRSKPPITPNYQVLNEKGQDHDKIFTLGAYLNDEKVGEGQGKSKKEAQIAAAQNAIENREKWEPKKSK